MLLNKYVKLFFMHFSTFICTLFKFYSYLWIISTHKHYFSQHTDTFLTYLNFLYSRKRKQQSLNPLYLLCFFYFIHHMTNNWTSTINIIFSTTPLNTYKAFNLAEHFEIFNGNKINLQIHLQQKTIFYKKKFEC